EQGGWARHANPSGASARFSPAIGFPTTPVHEKKGNRVRPVRSRALTHHKELTQMSSANKALFLVLIVASLGLWGCTQTPGNSSGSARIRDLEARNSKLEEDYQAAIQARDQARKKLEEKNTQQAKQLAELQTITHERDELKQLVNVRSSERD